MRQRILVLTLVLLAPATFAQSGLGTIAGTVTDPDKGLVAGIVVQAKHTGSGMVYRTDSSRAGTFLLQQLPAGTYKLSVPATGYTFFPYTQKDLVVASSWRTRTHGSCRARGRRWPQIGRA